MSINLCMRVFLFGNAVHERLVPLLSDKKLSTCYNDGTAFVRDKNVLDNGHAQFNVFQSNSVPYNTQLIVLPHDKEYADMQPAFTDSIFFVEDWTFLNSESLETAKKYRRDYPYNELRIVLFSSNRKTLSTDITTLETALNDAIIEYEKENFNVTIITEQDISTLFFWRERKYYDMLKRDFKDKLQNAKNAFESSYNSLYEMLCKLLKDDMLQPRRLDLFTCYEEKLGAEKIKQITYIVQAFFCNSSQFVIELDEIFKTFTKDVCLWDEDKVFRNLLDILVHQFEQDMKLALPPVSINRADEIVYNEFMYDTKFNVIFVQCCNNFFSNTAKVTIKDYINKLFTELEEFV